MIGLDFGTTNSALARVHRGKVELAPHSLHGALTETFRSVLYLSIEERVSAREPKVYAGPQAMEQYLEEGATGRYMQSLKSLLPSRTFEATQILGTVYSLEALVGHVLQGLRSGAERAWGPVGRSAVVGRPVRFKGADEATEALALERLASALAIAGFDDVAFEYEPIAAAYAYSQTLTHDETLLVADFGGGTSDFCLMRVGPVAAQTAAAERILATDGVGVAGDQFDARLVEHRIAPLLGRGSSYTSMTGDRFDVPDWLYVKLSNWHDLSFLRAPRPLQTLRELAQSAELPDRLKAFLYIVEENLGYDLYETVGGTKRELSHAFEASLAFHDGPVQVNERVERSDFDAWIQEDLDAIVAALDRCMGSAGVLPAHVDRVFMTGGTSFVPAVREIFEDTFGADRVVAGNELTSVAAGLALMAAERAQGAQTAPSSPGSR